MSRAGCGSGSFPHWLASTSILGRRRPVWPHCPRRTLNALSSQHLSCIPASDRSRLKQRYLLPDWLRFCPRRLGPRAPRRHRALPSVSNERTTGSGGCCLRSQCHSYRRTRVQRRQARGIQRRHRTPPPHQTPPPQPNAAPISRDPGRRADSDRNQQTTGEDRERQQRHSGERDPTGSTSSSGVTITVPNERLYPGWATATISSSGPEPDHDTLAFVYCVGPMSASRGPLLLRPETLGGIQVE